MFTMCINMLNEILQNLNKIRKSKNLQYKKIIFISFIALAKIKENSDIIKVLIKY